jgi:hypothetical protein
MEVRKEWLLMLAWFISARDYIWDYVCFTTYETMYRLRLRMRLCLIHSMYGTMYGTMFYIILSNYSRILLVVCIVLNIICDLLWV